MGQVIGYRAGSTRAAGALQPIRFARLECTVIVPEQHGQGSARRSSGALLWAREQGIGGRDRSLPRPSLEYCLEVTGFVRVACARDKDA
jgi:hypothetical protein